MLIIGKGHIAEGVWHRRPGHVEGPEAVVKDHLDVGGVTELGRVLHPGNDVGAELHVQGNLVRHGGVDVGRVDEGLIPVDLHVEVRPHLPCRLLQPLRRRPVLPPCHDHRDLKASAGLLYPPVIRGHPHLIQPPGPSGSLADPPHHGSALDLKQGLPGQSCGPVPGRYDACCLHCVLPPLLSPASFRLRISSLSSFSVSIYSSSRRSVAARIPSSMQIRSSSSVILSTDRVFPW